MASTSTAPVPMPVDQAISNLESAKATLTNDQQQQSNAQAAIDTAQSKLDAAKASKAPIDASVSQDVTNYNAACDQASAAILASKIAPPTAQ